MFEPLPALMPFIKPGRPRVLGVTTSVRLDSLLDLQIIAEFVSGYEGSGWNGVVAPRGTPASIVEVLNPAEFARLVAPDTDKWAKIIRANKFRAA